MSCEEEHADLVGDFLVGEAIVGDGVDGFHEAGEDVLRVCSNRRAMILERMERMVAADFRLLRFGKKVGSL